MPIHGHTKIELTSQTTGEVETIEKDNIVTNAVSQIFNAFNGMALLREANANGEYGSTSDKSWELPESLYGGILLYDTALGSDPDTLFAPPEANLVGSGVPKVLNNGKGLQRGSFNTTESKTDLKNGVVTFVYDFATSQANGTIASVCLTSRYGGFFGESETALPAADGSNTSSYYNSALFGQETIFPNAPGKNDRHLYGRPLYADPENDEMVFGAISNNKLVLRYATALTTEIDLFNPINTTRVKKTEERDLSDFLQVDHFSYSAVSYDVDADKICVVSTPGADQLKTTGLIRVRTYDRKTLEEKNYAFTNPTGVTLAGNVGGTVLNTATNEMHAIEALLQLRAVPLPGCAVLGQPAVPYMVRYDANSGNNQSTVHQGIRRNYLATINDLDAPVQKTADKTMKITYTLRREES